MASKQSVAAETFSSFGKGSGSVAVFIAYGGWGGEFCGVTWFSGGVEGDQMSLTEHKGGLLKLTANEGGRGRESSQYYRTSWRDNLNFIVPQAKSSNPPPFLPEP